MRPQGCDKETPCKLCVKEKRAQQKNKESAMKKQRERDITSKKMSKGLRYFWSLQESATKNVECDETNTKMSERSIYF